MIKKYILTEESKTITLPNNNEVTVYRIQALRDILSRNGAVLIKAGERGGFVESEHNLSLGYDSSWIFDEAIVCENSRVREGACVEGYAIIYGNTIVRGESTVDDNSIIGGNSTICENAYVEGNSSISNSMIGGKMFINGQTQIKNSQFFGSENINTPNYEEEAE